MATHRHIILASALVLAGGCYQGTEEAADIAATRGTVFNALTFNGITFNGLTFNGLTFNGLTFNGLTFNGLTFNGLTFNGLTFNGLELEGSEFSAAFIENGEEIVRGGVDLVGAEFDITYSQVVDDVETSEDFVLHIDDIYPDPNWDDVLLYEISYRSKLGGEWHPLCSDGQGNALPAIPMRNAWDQQTGDRIDDPNLFTFSCTNAVLAKCIEWGYRPWATATRCKDKKGWKKGKDCYEVSLEDYHQACTRMARADYCGDGQPWTVPGTPIDIWDHLSPQIEAPATDWAIEAEWTPDGAYCVSDMRQQGWKQQGLYPKCFLGKKGKPIKQKDCGSLKKHRALLVTAFDKYGEMQVP